MKVIVLYENTAERSAAENMARVIQGIAPTLMNARVVDNGSAIQVMPSRLIFPCEATCLSFAELANPRGLLHKEIQPRPKRGVRQLIFEDKDEV